MEVYRRTAITDANAKIRKLSLLKHRSTSVESTLPLMNLKQTITTPHEYFKHHQNLSKRQPHMLQNQNKAK